MKKESPSKPEKSNIDRKARDFASRNRIHGSCRLLICIAYTVDRWMGDYGK